MFVCVGELEVLMTAESQMFLTVFNSSSSQQDILLDTQFQLNIDPGQISTANP